ncbi:Tetratricopeptide-like helical [Penicillium coprophilum]|uniref:Tetratricopeptide-like helical n=1 Tax=Penicillium coprophilum TaxID=36646 RepID=UPI0023928B86|nr:Tetratricopeptide-like helical [Penicillium coprophilum]KAJ5159252.1 Tetratricopeptide-like helical [Penicillium coprophilum]
MARISDLIRDSKLETYFLPDCQVETVHTFQESDPTSGQRLVTRSEHWQRQKRIGRGGFGCVWLEKRTKGGRPGAIAQDGAVRAVKQIDTDPSPRSIDFNRELEAIAKFSHPRYERCFVKSFGWYEGPSQLFIAMEYLELGDLFAYLQSRPPVPEAEAKEIAYQILEGLTMMHGNGFAHRDLKPNNIMIKSHPPDKWWIKLADFGITKRIDENHGKSTTITGTPRYFAPETWGFVERGSAYATDMWALGEIVFEMLTKKSAFPNSGSLANYKTQQDFPITMLTDAGISQPGVDFVLSMMSLYPNDRMTAVSAMSSAWIESLVLHPPESMKATKGEPQTPYQVTIMTEEFASWTTKISSETPEDAFHGMSGSTTVVNMLNPAHGTAIITQKEKVYSSLGTAVPVVIQDQDQVAAPELRPTEAESQHQTGVALHGQKRFKEAEIILQEALQRRKEVLGYYHEETLRTAHWLGRSCYNQGQYREAGTMLRHALQGREKMLGRDHGETLSSTYWLGLSLYGQKRFREAETIFQQVFQRREKVLGHHHRETLRAAHWLGLSLYDQGQYKEAETIFRYTLQGREKVLGCDQEEALNSTHYLGLSLYHQQGYSEAENLFRRALYGREKALGCDHKETLNSTHYLGLSLYRLKRYSEAEARLLRALHGREKVLGCEEEKTLNSTHYLGLSLYFLKRYSEAENMFRRALHGREKVLGRDQEETLNSTHYLGLSLYRQNSYDEAEKMFERALQGRKKTLGHDHKDTLAAKKYMDAAHKRVPS